MQKENPRQNLSWQLLQESCQQQLKLQSDKGRYRSLQSKASSEFLELSSNDYLGIASQYELKQTILEACRELPVGSGASRLLSGEHKIFETLETYFSEWQNTESSLYVSSGYSANDIVARILGMSDCCFFSDSLNHASIIDGLRFAQKNKAKRLIYRHGDLNNLRTLLSSSEAKIKCIWSESIFSMDGDISEAKDLAEIAKDTQSILVIDEAHAIGCLGDQGRGLFSASSRDTENLIRIFPAGKALGASGAIICGPKWFKDTIINFARPFIYSTGASPWIAQALLLHTDWIRQQEKLRSRLQAISRYLRERLAELNLDTATSNSHIIPIILGDENRSISLQNFLLSHKIIARSIRPPTVAENSCRLRLSLRADLTDDHIEYLLRSIAKWKTQFF